MLAKKVNMEMGYQLKCCSKRLRKSTTPVSIFRTFTGRNLQPTAKQSDLLPDSDQRAFVSNVKSYSSEQPVVSGRNVSV